VTAIPADEVWRELWWIWPRKVGKQPALKAWHKAVKLASPEVILGGARRYADAVNGSDPMFVKHLGPWLNDQRWTDEPEPRSGRRNGHQTFRSPGVDAYVGEL
jgi:hypothetical protein